MFNISENFYVHSVNISRESPLSPLMVWLLELPGSHSENKDPSDTITDFIKSSSKEYTCETLNSPLHVGPSFSVFSQVLTPTTAASHVAV